jgi:SNF2 family DNA or RNA helicase
VTTTPDFYETQKKSSILIKKQAEPTISLESLGPQAPLSMEQVLGVEFLYKIRRAILADEVGLGKTAIFVSLLRLLSELGEGNRFLVLASASILLQWAEEVTKYAPGIQIIVIAGGTGKKKRMVRYGQVHAWGQHPVLVLTSYEVFALDIEEFLKIQWDAMGVDESSAIKNRSTKRFKAVKRMGPIPTWLVMLTATPIENDVTDLYNNVDILYPGYLGPYDGFTERYTIQYDIPLRVNAHYYRTIKKTAGFRRLDELRERIEWLILRRKPEDVGIEYPELKPPTRIYLDMLPLQKKVYRDIRDGILESANRVKKVKTLARFKYLFGCVDGSLAQYPGLTPKIEAAIKLIKAFVAGGKKVVVFSHSKRVVYSLEPEIAKLGINTLKITGDENSPQRNRAKDMFNSDPEYPVIFITTAGSRGLNLAGAHNIIMYNSTYNPALNHQIVGRIMRRTQESPYCYVWELYCKNSIEKSLLETLERKKELFDRVIEGADKIPVSPTKNMSVTELLSALRRDESEFQENL